VRTSTRFLTIFAQEFGVFDMRCVAFARTGTLEIRRQNEPIDTISKACCMDVLISKELSAEHNFFSCCVSREWGHSVCS
jgi:hypothetical protein